MKKAKEKPNIKELLNSLLEKSESELDAVFGFDVKDVKIKIANTRKAYEKIVKRKTPAWVIGEIRSSKTILILSPLCWSKDAPMHKPGEESWLIKHELTHLYVKKYFKVAKTKCPNWLDEGIAVFLSGQSYDNYEKNPDNAKKFFDLLNDLNKNWEEVWTKMVAIKIEPYGVSAHIIKYLSQKMSLNEILDFIKDNNGKISQKIVDDFINNYLRI